MVHFFLFFNTDSKLDSEIADSTSKHSLINCLINFIILNIFSY